MKTLAQNFNLAVEQGMLRRAQILLNQDKLNEALKMCLSGIEKVQVLARGDEQQRESKRVELYRSLDVDPGIVFGPTELRLIKEKEEVARYQEMINQKVPEREGEARGFLSVPLSVALFIVKKLDDMQENEHITFIKLQFEKLLKAIKYKMKLRNLGLVSMKNQLNKISDATGQKEPSKAGRKNYLCPHIEAGRCGNGENCRYAHHPNEIQLIDADMKARQLESAIKRQQVNKDIGRKPWMPSQAGQKPPGDPSKLFSTEGRASHGRKKKRDIWNSSTQQIQNMIYEKYVVRSATTS